MKDIQLKPEDLASVSAPYWLHLKKVRIDGKPFTLEGRAYQQEIMQSRTLQGEFKHSEVIRKGSQIGITIGKVGEATHGAKFGLYPQGIIFYFPTKTAVDIFSAARFKPFIEDNPEEIGAIMGKTNRGDMRRIGATNVYFFGGSATSRVGGEKKDSNAVRQTPADWVLLDERDLFDDEMAKQVNQRLGNSTIWRRSDIGTPTIPDFGVDLLYKKSDMRRWQIKCACGKFTCAETEFPKVIRIQDGKGVLSCIHCGRPIDSNNGTWEPDCPGRPTIGYWPSQLLNPNANLALILQQYADPEAFDIDKGEFMRTVMGMPYISEEDALSESDVYACCTGQIQAHADAGPCAMGVDVGNPLYAVIGHRLGDKQYRVIYYHPVPDFGALSDLIRRFNVKSLVIDAQPEYHKVREFQGAHAGTYLCYYSEHLKSFDSWSDEGIINVNRTEILDATADLVRTAGKLTLPARSEETKLFAHQMTRSVRVLETDQATGRKIYRYRCRGDKEDHYRHAMNYFYLACKRVGIPLARRQMKKMPTTQNMTYKLGVAG